MELYREWVGDALKKLENKDKLIDSGGGKSLTYL